MIDGWGPIAKAVDAFLEKNPKFRRIGDQLWTFVMSRLAPRSEAALLIPLEQRESIEGLTERENFVRHLNLTSPQSEAHCRTMQGGVGEVLAEFKGRFGPALDMDDEAQKVGDAIAEEQKQVDSTDFKSATEPTPVYPSPRKRR